MASWGRALLPLLLLPALSACPSSSEGPAPSPSVTTSTVASTPPLPSAAPSASADPLALKPLSPRGQAALAKSMEHLEFLAGVDAPRPMRSAKVADTFLVVAGDSSAPFDAAVAVVQQTVDAAWRGPFRHKPEWGTLVWIFGSAATYQPKRRLIAPYTDATDLSVYLPDDDTILFCPEGSSIDTLRHEVLHALLDADMPHAPAWIAEGIPSLEEAPDLSNPAERHGKAHYRLQSLRTALGRKDYAPQVRLDVLFTLVTSDDFRKGKLDGSWQLHQAMAREFVRWADSKHVLWKFYHAFRDGIRTDPTGEKAFAAAFDGATPASATQEWLDWITSPEAE